MLAPGPLKVLLHADSEDRAAWEELKASIEVVGPDEFMREYRDEHLNSRYSKSGRELEQRRREVQVRQHAKSEGGLRTRGVSGHPDLEADRVWAVHKEQPRVNGQAQYVCERGGFVLLYQPAAKEWAVIQSDEAAFTSDPLTSRFGHEFVARTNDEARFKKDKTMRQARGSSSSDSEEEDMLSDEWRVGTIHCAGALRNGRVAAQFRFGEPRGWEELEALELTMVKPSLSSRLARR